MEFYVIYISRQTLVNAIELINFVKRDATEYMDYAIRIWKSVWVSFVKVR